MTQKGEPLNFYIEFERKDWFLKIDRPFLIVDQKTATLQKISRNNTHRFGLFLPVHDQE